MGSTAATGDLVDRARGAYRARDWIGARDAFGAAASAASAATLDGDDLYAWANAHWWLGDLDHALPKLEEAFRSHLAAGAPRAAAVVGIDLGYTLALRGEEAQASGWLSRAARLLADEPDCAEKAHLRYLDVENGLATHDLDAAGLAADDVLAAGRRFGDPNLVALGVLGQGRVLVKRGRVSDGLKLLDEAMVAAVSDSLDPALAGNIYCHLMSTCYELGDLRRADEWTSVTARWCESMPGAGPFLGICRVHRAQVLQARGQWDQAEAEVRRVSADLSGFHTGMVGEAHYCLGDLARQRGDLDAADGAYARAHALGRDPCPGLALLRLAQGRAATAAALINRALATCTEPLARARLLPAGVEIGLANGDVGGARACGDELSAIAATFETTGLLAQADAAEGALMLAAGDPAGAIAVLRRAQARWQQLRAPYEAARVRTRLARAHEALGEPDAAALEAASARAELARLGAVLPAEPRRRPRPDGLSAREGEILGLVADGRTNHEIAEALVLSVRTVERHLSTIYQKLGLHGPSARAAAVRHALGGERQAP